ncbi:non-ribosomal peptide synthetase [Xenorhabdus bovienii]|uniref:non-ribosomal peptide synthetase n=1 Tax=Xenorhabdus bovienii TaxID=40576 RepID=UPI0023B31F92|nr:non-ribosomal peptide synthetase [Xenorhabdus bovienii]MDE9495788.1 non-ribosomal peptide synthetase [Xenorhabdus bovienii]MDE9504201.1 non-ribosomal peptide synthetase [Xenorhabdus bovienii]MDE9527901.1 non-ribosomal peptide synthetase [Xenorhabdus bovienii]
MASEKIIHSKVLLQTNKTPDLIALRCDENIMTYQQLEQRSNALAGYLIKHGVKPGNIVGVYINKGIDLVISLLGILKAGGCYLPLDPYYPHERLTYMISHSKTAFIITDNEQILTLLQCDCIFINIKTLNLTLNNQLILPKVNDDHLCYVMYTSGSTGVPKGVMVSHRTVVNYLEWMQSEFILKYEDVVLNQSTFSFDVSVWEIFWPLIAGASCALITEEIKFDPFLMAKFINRHDITVAQFVPTALRTIVGANVLSGCPSLKHLFAGGEVLDQSLVNELTEQFKGQIHNLYGPTEATIFACHWYCRAGEKEKTVPIGKAIPHARTYVLNEYFQPVPVGECGELYLAGDILAKGYLYEEPLTQKCFVNDSFSCYSNQKMYRTGDLVKQRPDNILEFIGRIDDQIKMRGYRIELEEIERHLLSHPYITHAAVVIDDPSKNKNSSLSAYDVLHHQQSVNVQDIKKYLLKFLPYFMLPSYFIELDKIPVHPNGKIDKSNFSLYVNENNKYFVDENLNTGIEEIIISIWKPVLNNRNFSKQDNFFDIGGNSLLMSKVYRQIKKKFSVPISIMDLFQYPSVQMLSRYICEKRADILREKE